MSVFFAIRDAIGSTKEGVFDFDAPATVENIRMSLNDPFAKKVNIKILKSFNPWFLEHQAPRAADYRWHILDISTR